MLVWTKIQQNCKYVMIMPLLANIFVKRNVRKKGHGWFCSLYIFFHNHHYQGGTGKSINKALISDNKQA